MKVLTDGHKYELSSFEGGEPQVIQFIEKVPVQPGSSKLETLNDGTTNEEVIKVLLHRLNYLQEKFPCDENKNAIIHLEFAYQVLHLRTLRREVQAVEGKQLAHKS